MDSKSIGPKARGGSSPSAGTRKPLAGSLSFMELRIEHRIDASVEDAVRASHGRSVRRQAHRAAECCRANGNDVRQATGRLHTPDSSVPLGGSLPGPVLKAIGGSTVSWDEEGTFDPTRNEWRYEIHPHVMKGRFKCNGRYAFVADGETTKRVVEADISVSIPLVGGRVAKVIADGMKDTLEAEAKLLNEYVGARS